MTFELWINGDYFGAHDTRDQAKDCAKREAKNYEGEPTVRINEISQWAVPNQELRDCR